MTPGTEAARIMRISIRVLNSEANRAKGLMAPARFTYLWSSRLGASGSKLSRVYRLPESLGSSATNETTGSPCPCEGSSWFPSCTEAPELGKSIWIRVLG